MSTRRFTPLVAALLLQACGAAAPTRPATAPASTFANLAVLEAAPVDAQISSRFGTNPTVDVAAAPVASVPLSADDGAFEDAARSLSAGLLPAPDAVRTESFLAALAPTTNPSRAAALMLSSEHSPSPFRSGYSVLRVAVWVPGCGAAVCLGDARLSVRFDGSRVTRYRLIGHESSRPAGVGGAVFGSQGGLLPGGVTHSALFELQGDVAAPGEAGVSGVNASGAAVEIHEALCPVPAGHEGVALVLAAALAERLRQSYWARALDLDALRTRFDTLPADLRIRPALVRLRQMLDGAAVLDSGRDPFVGRGAAGATAFDELPVLQP